jgi:hypothetical protein
MQEGLDSKRYQRAIREARAKTLKVKTIRRTEGKSELIAIEVCRVKNSRI